MNHILVSIVDELDQPICTFAVQFRKNPDFHEGALYVRSGFIDENIQMAESRISP